MARLVVARAFATARCVVARSACLRFASSQPEPLPLGVLARLADPAAISALPLSSRLSVARLGRLPPAQRTAVPAPARVFVAIARTLQNEDLAAIATDDLAELLVSLRAGLAAGGSVALRDGAAAAAMRAVEDELALRENLGVLDDELLADLFSTVLSHVRSPVVQRVAREVGRRAGGAENFARRAMGKEAAAHDTLPKDEAAVVEAEGSGPATVEAQDGGATAGGDGRHWRRFAWDGAVSAVAAGAFFIAAAFLVSFSLTALRGSGASLRREWKLPASLWHGARSQQLSREQYMRWRERAQSGR